MIEHSSELVNNICSLSSETTNVLAIFENPNLYNFNYFGFNINDEYSKLKSAVAARGIKTAELKHRSLDSFVYQEVHESKLYLMIPNVQQIRSFQKNLNQHEKQNIIGIQLLDYRINKIREIDIYTPLTCNNNSIINFPQSVSKDHKLIEQLCGIDLKNYDEDNVHATSTVFKPHNSGTYLYKALKGQYPGVWLEKIDKYRSVVKFLNRNNIPNAIPEIISDVNLCILKQQFIDGISLYNIASHKGIMDNLGSDDRTTISKFQLELSHAVYFYHFLGIYISDLKEDNFFYLNGHVVPIDSDGFSFDIYPSSQPRAEYQSNKSVSAETFYYQTSDVEAYSMALLLFKVFFNKMVPIDCNDNNKNLNIWCKKNFNDSTNQREKAKLQMWYALPRYIQVIFLFFFCNENQSIKNFCCDEWNEILQLYHSDLKLPLAVKDYYNKDNAIFSCASDYSFLNLITIKSHKLLVENKEKISLIRILRNALIVANGITFVAILSVIIKIFLT